MSKFKVGDKVRILDGSHIDDYAGVWIPAMINCVGKEATIEEVSASGRACRLKEYGLTWDERGLELISSTNETIAIYRKDNQTIGILKQDGKVVKRSVAKCSPEDTYSFEAGARLAMDRLFSPDAYNHKIVCIESTSHEEFPSGFKKGRIYTVKDGALCDDGGNVYMRNTCNKEPYTCIDEINGKLYAQFIELDEED